MYENKYLIQLTLWRKKNDNQTHIFLGLVHKIKLFKTFLLATKTQKKPAQVYNTCAFYIDLWGEHTIPSMYWN